MCNHTIFTIQNNSKYSYNHHHSHISINFFHTFSLTYPIQTSSTFFILFFTNLHTFTFPHLQLFTSQSFIKSIYEICLTDKTQFLQSLWS